MRKLEVERLPDLNIPRNAISNCINSQHGCSFTQFVNTYRVEYAQKLMRQQPDIKISEVWMSSGFSTERTFLRTFKQQTGMTPSNWKLIAYIPQTTEQNHHK